MVVTRARRTPALRGLALVGAALAVGLGAVGLSGVLSATGSSFPAATPQAACGPGAREETGLQGRVPQADYDSGRAAKGYRCNTRQVAHQGRTGGFKVLRYTDAHGHTCAFYDSTLLFPKDSAFQLVSGEGMGLVVLDMDDPRNPRKTATLTTAAMDTPHESVLVNQRRGLLAAVSGNAATLPGVFDLYDVRTDCRHPRLLSSTPAAILGHESGWSPDGLTFYASSTSGQTLVALDLTDPTSPTPVFTQARVVSDLSWPEHSIPQVPQPFTRNGRDYLLEVDEFANYSLSAGADQSSAPVGAARIIDVTEPERPVVVSNLRLQVHQPGARRGPQQDDPGARIPVQGYAAHYCSVPYARNPRVVACSMILSGLRIFDISRLTRPREVGYFNEPLTPR